MRMLSGEKRCGILMRISDTVIKCYLVTFNLCSLSNSGNKFLLQTDQTWKHLTRHFNIKGALVDAENFLPVWEPHTKLMIPFISSYFNEVQRRGSELQNADDVFRNECLYLFWWTVSDLLKECDFYIMLYN